MAKKKTINEVEETVNENIQDDIVETKSEPETRSNDAGGSLLKKILPVGIACLLILLAFVLGTRFGSIRNNGYIQQNQNNPVFNNNPTSNAFNQSKDNFIGEDKATEIALKNAGVSASEAKWLRSHLDFDDGFYHYDVSFISNDMEYEFELDPVSGDIWGFDMESIYD